ncbi:MAG TPA: hypothetical protein VGC89_11345, partial [Pyrinomonadaceae bacterium]
ALSEGYRATLPHGSYPAALLFLEVPLEEVDVNVHPAKTEVRFRRAAAVADAVREAVRGSLVSAGYVRAQTTTDETTTHEATGDAAARAHQEPATTIEAAARESRLDEVADVERALEEGASTASPIAPRGTRELVPPARQTNIEFGVNTSADDDARMEATPQRAPQKADTARGLDEIMRAASIAPLTEALASVDANQGAASSTEDAPAQARTETSAPFAEATHAASEFPPLVSAANLVREVPVVALKSNIRPLGQLADSLIIAIDEEGLLLIDQHVAHERVLFEKYRDLEQQRNAESQNLLMPETFDLTPAQAAIFETVAPELEAYGFSLMRLSGRTVAIKAVPADLPATEARNMLAEILDHVEMEKRGAARAQLRERIASRLACGAAVKAGTPLSIEKMRWLIERLLLTTSPTTGTHGRPVILRLAMRDIERGFQRS